MRVTNPPGLTVRLAIALAGLGLVLLQSVDSLAQTSQGATLTVLAGEVAVIHADGSARQPAPSGTVVSPGDQIRTVGRSGALITFFAGTEIELGADTALTVDSISRQGDQVQV